MSEKMTIMTGQQMTRPTKEGQYGRTYQTSGIKALGGRSGFYAIRDKETGQIHVPSAYYGWCNGKTEQHWDSANNTLNTKGVWEITKYMDSIKKLLERYRKKSEDFELIAFYLKDASKGIPYDTGYTSGTSIYYGGPCPLPRKVANEIQEIVVLQSSVYPNSKNAEVIDKDAIQAIEVEVV